MATAIHYIPDKREGKVLCGQRNYLFADGDWWIVSCKKCLKKGGFRK